MSNICSFARYQLIQTTMHVEPLWNKIKIRAVRLIQILAATQFSVRTQNYQGGSQFVYKVYSLLLIDEQNLEQSLNKSLIEITRK